MLRNITHDLILNLIQIVLPILYILFVSETRLVSVTLTRC